MLPAERTRVSPVNAFSEPATSQRRNTEVRLSHRWRKENSLARPAVEMITAAVVTLSKIGQFSADPRQSRRARQFAKLAGHLAAMIAIRDCHLRFTHGDADPWNNRAAGGSNTPLSAIPARRIIKLVTHNRIAEQNNSFRMWCIVIPNTEKDSGNIDKAPQSSLNFP
jgi:hypothetical protein